MYSLVICSKKEQTCCLTVDMDTGWNEEDDTIEDKTRLRRRHKNDVLYDVTCMIGTSRRLEAEEIEPIESRTIDMHTSKERKDVDVQHTITGMVPS